MLKSSEIGGRRYIVVVVRFLVQYLKTDFIDQKHHYTK